MKHPQNNFGKRVRELRKRQGMTLADLAQKLGCSVATISGAERGEFPPAKHILLHLPAALQHDGAELWALAARDWDWLYVGVNTTDAMVNEAAKCVWFGSERPKDSPEPRAPLVAPVIGEDVDYALGSDAPLRCPGCGSENLHHDRVEVFERTEDAERGLHAVVTHVSITTNTSMAGNPSSRRQGLTIHFWCECCPVRSVLRVSQHKGSTFVDIAKEHYV